MLLNERHSKFEEYINPSGRKYILIPWATRGTFTVWDDLMGWCVGLISRGDYNLWWWEMPDVDHDCHNAFENPGEAIENMMNYWREDHK